MNILGASTQYKVRHCSQCQGDTEFYCHTCKHDLCLLCKKKHLTDKNSKYHHVVLYVTRHTERGFTTQSKIRQCDQCQGDTEFYCDTCTCDLCLQCKESHFIDLDTIDHDVMVYREFECFPLRETCARHPNRKYRMFCDMCKCCVCKRCTAHRTHALMDLRTTYQTKRQQHREIIDNIRSKTLYNCYILLVRIQTDIQTCPQQIYQHQSRMSAKVQRLKDLIDTVVCDVARYRGLLIARIQRQKRKINRQLVLHLQNSEDRYEQSANRAVQFLLFIKTSRVSQIKNSRVPPIKARRAPQIKTSRFPRIKDSPCQLLRIITEIQMSTGKRQVGIDERVKETSIVSHTDFCVKHVRRVLHISGVTSDLIWISNKGNLILTDTTGDTIHRVTDIIPRRRGIHTVNSSGELIYIDQKFNIKKLSEDNKIVTTLLERPSQWHPWSVYCCPLTGDLMVGMYNPKTHTGKIIRYNSTGQQILTIQHDDTGKALYRGPEHITENRNGDIIVSDLKRVVVTDRGGKYRFLYTGSPSESSLWPLGICTDALSHILVCDDYSTTVQMIDKDGHYLGILLALDLAASLNYDDKTHLLWVGSFDSNIVSVYRYIQRRYSLTNNPDSDEWITEDSSYEELENSEIEMETNEVSEYEENSDDLYSEYTCSTESLNSAMWLTDNSSDEEV